MTDPLTPEERAQALEAALNSPTFLCSRLALELHAEVITVCQREAATHQRHDAKVEKLEQAMSAEVERLTRRVVADSLSLIENEAEIERLRAASVWPEFAAAGDDVSVELAVKLSYSEERADSLADEVRRLREALWCVIHNVETGSYESTGQAIDDARAVLSAPKEK